MAEAIPQQAPAADDGYCWMGSPVRQYVGSINDVAAQIPTFDRRPFALPLGDATTGKNPNLDVVVRLPLLPLIEQEVPVGVVGKTYRLVQHREVLEMAVSALKEAKIDPTRVRARIRLTEYGERMALCLILPDREAYRFSISEDGQDAMNLRFDCWNSVEGSTKLVAILGWQRWVCENGLVIGASLSDLRRAHSPELELADLRVVLSNSLKLAASERRRYQTWLRTKIEPNKLDRWADGPLRNAWGAKAATRALHITRSGYDVQLANPFEAAPPSHKTVLRGARVPGWMIPFNTAFAVGQSLSWLAGHRRELPEQLEWMRQIPGLVHKLISMN